MGSAFSFGPAAGSLVCISPAGSPCQLSPPTSAAGSATSHVLPTELQSVKAADGGLAEHLAKENAEGKQSDPLLL